MRQFPTNLRLRKIDSTMQEDKLTGISDLLSRYGRILASMNMWPRNNNNVRFTAIFVYVLIHLGMEYADFIHHIGNLEVMATNLSESATFTILLVKLAVFYKNRTLGQLIDAVNEDCANGKFRTFEEQRKYAVYYSMANSFYKILVPLSSTTAILYYLRPIAGYLLTTSHNNSTIPFVLPFRTHIFYEITDVYAYTLIYTYQLGALYFVCLGTIGSDGLFIALTMHLCGQLSVLAESIAKLTRNTKNDHQFRIRRIIEQHLRLIRMRKQIDKVFNTVCLGLVLGYASLICMTGVVIVINSEMMKTTTLLNFVLFGATALTALYGYCFVGECLIEESQRVSDAFYQCSWYEMPPSHSQDLVVLIVISQKPFHLSAGKFCIFSFELFTRSHLLSAAEVVDWNRRILGLLGIWPEDPRNLRFSLFLGYLIIHVTLEYMYLYQNIKNLEHVVTIRDYRSDQEVKIFLEYNTIAKNYVRAVVPLIFSSSIVYFAKPLFTQFLSIEGNNTLYDLPYRVHLFHDVADIRVYVLTYAIQTPLVIIATFGYTGTDCLLITLTLHVCGELSILAIRIKNLKCNSRGYRKAIRTLINKHVQLIRMATIIEDVFNVLLLGQLFGGTFLICFLGYNVLANTTGGRETDLLNFSLYGFSVVVLLYVYCYVGDCLTQESVKVRDAFFHCPWYELRAKNSKSFVTCIIQSQKPLHLTAGKFYVFSLARFADVIKTSTAYLSVLRTFV